MKYLLTLIVISILFFCCKNESSDRHIAPGIMKKLLTDIHMAEAYSTYKKDSLHRSGVKNTDSLSVYYTDILAHYKLTPQQLNESLEWYENHPEDLDTMYAEMITVIAGMQGKAPALPAGSNKPVELPGKR